MTYPLPTRSAPEVPTFDRDGVSWSEYVRKVEFVDRHPQGPGEAPVHIAGLVKFDGVATAAAISKDFGITVDLAASDATVVTMSVHRDDVQIGGVDDEGTYTPWLIGGRRVLTPVGEGWAWIPEDPEDSDCEWIVCSIFVAEVHIY